MSLVSTHVSISATPSKPYNHNLPETLQTLETELIVRVCVYTVPKGLAWQTPWPSV